LRGYPRELGLEFIKIDSNLSDILKWKFEQTFVPRNVSAILMLQKLFAKYYLSSSYKYEDCVIKPHFLISLTEPMSVHLLSTEMLECISVGSQYSRVEKTRRMANVPGSNRWLNVCVSPSPDGENCSVCAKCCRTLLTLEMLGILENFAQVFDLYKWRKVKNGYLIKALEDKNDIFIKEIRDYAKSVVYSFKPLHLVASKLLHLAIGASNVSLFKVLKAIYDYIHLQR
jgi:hypothetical protein